MFLGLQWYWWLTFIIIFAISIPFKVKFLKWWEKRNKNQKRDEDNEEDN